VRSVRGPLLGFAKEPEVVPAVVRLSKVVRSPGSRVRGDVCRSVALVMAISLAIHVLSLPGTEENGPSVLEMLDARTSNDDESIEETALDALDVYPVGRAPSSRSVQRALPHGRRRRLRRSNGLSTVRSMSVKLCG
jgi:hypothetical protein